MTLEEALREAAAKGLTHLSVWPVHSEDRKTTYWAARATPSTGHSYVQTQALDPAEAMAEVLKALPKAKARSLAKVTATVTEAPAELHPELESEIDRWLPQA